MIDEELEKSLTIFDDDDELGKSLRRLAINHKETSMELCRAISIHTQRVDYIEFSVALNECGIDHKDHLKVYSTLFGKTRERIIDTDLVKQKARKDGLHAKPRNSNPTSLLFRRNAICKRIKEFVASESIRLSNEMLKEALDEQWGSNV